MHIRQNLILAVAMIVVAALAAPFAASSEKVPLNSVVVVIDPGHGGKDPGAFAIFRDQPIYEAPYVYDVALRLERAVKARGGVAYLTRRDLKAETPDDRLAARALPFSRQDVYTSGGGSVRAGVEGLLPRVALAREVKQKHPHSRVVFVSIHFDSVGSPNIAGMSVVVPKAGPPRIALALEKTFREARLVRKDGSRELRPITVSGDAAHGMRSILVLGRRNPIGERVLIELGNFRSEADVWRIRNPGNREKYASLIADAIGLKGGNAPPAPDVAKAPTPTTQKETVTPPKPESWFKKITRKLFHW